MQKKRILVLGSSYIDFVAKVKRAPERGESIVSNLDHSFLPGGHGLISAITAAKLGSDVIFCSRIGDDDNGKKILDVLRSHNVDTRFVVTDKRKPTGLNSIVVEDSFRSRIISYPGANNALSMDDVEMSFTSYPDAFLMNLDMREDLYADAFKYIKTTDTLTVVSCGNEADDVDPSFFEGVEIFSPNKLQAYKLTGIDPVDANSALHASIKIANRLKCKYVVMKLGDRGAFVYDGVYSDIIPAHNVEVVDTRCAGVIFGAALAHAYLEFEDINKAAMFANAASSFSVSVDGLYSSVPGLDDVKAMFD